MAPTKKIPLRGSERQPIAGFRSTGQPIVQGSERLGSMHWLRKSRWREAADGLASKERAGGIGRKSQKGSCVGGRVQYSLRV